MAQIILTCSSAPNSSTFKNKARLRVTYEAGNGNIKITGVEGTRIDSTRSYSASKKTINITINGSKQTASLSHYVDFTKNSVYTSFGINELSWSCEGNQQILIKMPSSDTAFGNAEFVGFIDAGESTIAPILNNPSLSDITETSIYSFFSVYLDGGAPIVDYYTDIFTDAECTNKIETIGQNGTFTGLTANTQYYVRANASNGVYRGYSNVVAVRTYQYPYIKQATPSFIVEKETLQSYIYNPLNRAINIHLKQKNINGQDLFSKLNYQSGSGENILFTPELNNDVLYNSIPESSESTAILYCEYDNHIVQTIDTKYVLSAELCSPSFSSFNYEDINEKTLALTGNNQALIKGYSTLKISIPNSLKAIAQKGSSMRYYASASAGVSKVDYSDTDDVFMIKDCSKGNLYNILTVFAVDKRSFSKAVDKVIENFYEYEDLVKLNGTAKRVDNSDKETGVSESTKIHCEGKFWNESFGKVNNTIKSVSYQYKSTSDPDFTQGTTPLNVVLDNNKFTIDAKIKGDTDNGFAIGKTYLIQVIVKDELSPVVFNLTLASGKPLVAYAEKGVSFGGKYNDENGGAIQVDGVPLLEYEIIESFE